MEIKRGTDCFSQQERKELLLDVASQQKQIYLLENISVVIDALRISDIFDGIRLACLFFEQAALNSKLQIVTLFFLFFQKESFSFPPFDNFAGRFFLGIKNFTLNLVVYLTFIDSLVKVSSILHLNTMNSFIDRLVLGFNQSFSVLKVLSESSALNQGFQSFNTPILSIEIDNNSQRVAYIFVRIDVDYIAQNQGTEIDKFRHLFIFQNIQIVTNYICQL